MNHILTYTLNIARGLTTRVTTVTNTCLSIVHTSDTSFNNTKKKSMKKLTRIEASSICRQLFANVFADCFCAVQTHQP